MSWNKERSAARIRAIDDRIPAIEISRLERKMDLDNVTLGKPKIVEGVHVYAAVANEAAHITDLLDPSDQDGAKRPLRAVHLWQREIGRIVCNDFDAAKIHFQGTRLHGLVYRPIGSQTEVVGRAVALAMRLKSPRVSSSTTSWRMTPASASPAEPRSEKCSPLAAARPVTRSSSSWATPLTRAPRQSSPGLDSASPPRSSTLWATSSTGPTSQTRGDGYYRLSLTQAGVEAVVEKYKLGWSLANSRKRITSDLDNTPLDRVGVSKATASIDKDRLSLANSKLNDSVSLFGDADGFTAMVEEATTDDAKQRMIRRFHIMRAELRHVTVQDFDTLRVQYQGDRIQALRHMPHGEESARALRAVRLAAAWQSSMEETLTPALGELSGVHLAVGLGVGPTVVSKLGEHGNRDMICLGKAVRRAAKIEGALDGDEVGICDAVTGLLPQRVANLFTWDGGKNCHVARGLRFNDVVLAEEAEKLDTANGSNGNDSSSAPAVGSGLREHAPRPRWHA